jgi:hypothetical protein
VFFLSAAISVAQSGFDSSEDLIPVNVFGVGLSSDSPPNHK